MVQKVCGQRVFSAVEVNTKLKLESSVRLVRIVHKDTRNALSVKKEIWRDPRSLL